MMPSIHNSKFPIKNSLRPIPNSKFSIQNSKLPLYLGNHTEVSLDDGPSLVVSKPELVHYRYPLQRISRLMIASGVCIQADVIPACFIAGISLIWCNRDGSALAVGFPLQGTEQRWAERIAVMMARADWQSCYQAWVAAQQNIALRSLSRRFNIPLAQVKKEAWLDLVWQQHGIRRRWAMYLLQAWQAMTALVIVEYWRNLGVQVEQLSSPADGWNVLQDMADTLVLDMVAELVWRKKKWKRLMGVPRNEIDFAVIQTFERQRPRLLRILGAMHARFHRWLLDMEPWR